MEGRMAEFEPVANTRDVGPGDLREVRAHGRRLGITNVGQTYYAFDATCPADGTNLAAAGRLVGDQVVCPADHAIFDVRTGERIDLRGQRGLTRYAIRVEDNQVKIGPPLAS